MSKALFGPGGNGDLFYAEGGKGTVDAPRWLAGYGLFFLRRDDEELEG